MEGTEEDTAPADGEKVVTAVELLAARRDKLQHDKLRIGALCSSLLESPEKKVCLQLFMQYSWCFITLTNYCPPRSLPLLYFFPFKFYANKTLLNKFYGALLSLVPSISVSRHKSIKKETRKSHSRLV